MTQPERDRIFAALGGQFVEKGFDRKHVALRAQRPQRGGADRHGQQAMAFDLPRRKIIQRNRVAIGAAAIGLRRIGRDHARERICDFGSREQSRLRRAPRPRRVAVAPDAVAPVDDLALRIEIGLDLDRHRRAERRMRHLVFARPLHADRPAAGGFRQQHGVERDIVGGVVAVAAGAFHMLDRDVLDRQFEHQREIGAQQIDALAVGPDVDAVAGPLRHRAGRRDRRMRDIGAGILPPDGALFRRCRGCRFLVDDRRFRRLRFQERGQLVFIGQRFAHGPHRPLAQRLERGLRAILGFADHAREIAVAHDGDEAGHRAGAVFRQSVSFARAFSGRSTRPCSIPATPIVDEARPREHLVGNIHALHGTSSQRACVAGFGVRPASRRDPARRHPASSQ